MINEIHQHLLQIVQFRILHTCREANQAADGLTNFAIQQ